MNTDIATHIKARYIQKFNGERIECVLLDNDGNRLTIKLFDPATETLKTATEKFSALYS